MLRILSSNLKSSLKQHSLFAPISKQQKLYSTLNSTPRPEPSVVAESIINKLPGSSLAAKTSTALFTAAVASWLISKEIYILDGEIFEMACLFGAYAIWYVNGKEGAAGYFKTRKDSMLKILTDARKDHKQVVQERITHISKVNELSLVTKPLYDVSREIVEMEAKVYELSQKVAFTAQVKSTLDAWVRHEANVRDQEQKNLSLHVIETIKSQLKDPKLQQMILKQTLADVEKIASMAKK